MITEKKGLTECELFYLLNKITNHYYMEFNDYYFGNYIQLNISREQHS